MRLCYLSRRKKDYPIYEGLIEVGYNEANIFTVNDLQEATAVILRIARPKDIVLFENDLPDNYSE